MDPIVMQILIGLGYTFCILMAVVLCLCGEVICLSQIGRLKKLRKKLKRRRFERGSPKLITRKLSTIPITDCPAQLEMQTISERQQLMVRQMDNQEQKMQGKKETPKSSYEVVNESNMKKQIVFRTAMTPMPTEKISGEPYNTLYLLYTV